MRPTCPLCEVGKPRPYSQDERREYWSCPICSLVMVPPRYHLSLEAEKAEYDLHENDPGDAGYRTFLSRLSTPLKEMLPSGSRGLDFGCGPGPTLSVMLEEAGHEMDVFDPFYAKDQRVFQNRYDFITATEVVEHLHRPGQELNRLFSMLEPRGVLGIMTKLIIDETAFSKWHYKNDPTHVCFFSRGTFDWVAASWGAQVRQFGADVTILRKQDRPSDESGRER